MTIQKKDLRSTQLKDLFDDMNEAIKYAFKYIEELETELENKEIHLKELCEYAADIRAVAFQKKLNVMHIEKFMSIFISTTEKHF